LKPGYRERGLPSPGLADLRLDRHARIFDLAAVEYFLHPVDHGLLEPSVHLLGILAFG